MKRFLLLDHSLRQVGGHHYDYDLNILRAAEEAGFSVHLATHEAFRGKVPPNWPVYPIFKHDTYSKTAIAFRRRARVRADDGNADRSQSGKHSSPFPGLTDWLSEPPRRLHRSLLRMGVLPRRRRFARDCHRLFDRVRVDLGDQVFVPTLSEIDFLALVSYLRDAPHSRTADWHLQFQFDLLDGREPDYAGQRDRIDNFRRLFSKAIAQIPDHKVHFYCTTPRMAGQYNLLGVASFRSLPYPVSAAFRAVGGVRVVPEPEPFDVVCAGVSREEKGRSQLEGLLSQLDGDTLQKVRLLVQEPRARSRPWPFRSDRAQGSRTPARSAWARHVVRLPHPLPVDDYVEFVRSADIGLFLYDSERYYVRVSGVLVEMLSSGVPVIVPAGSWLADQVAEEVCCHVEKVLRALPTMRSVSEEATESTDHTGVSVTAAQSATLGGEPTTLTSEVSVPSGATDAVVSFRWPDPNAPGTYVRLQIDQLGASGFELARFTAILDQRPLAATVPSLVHLREEAARLRLTWRNAYHRAPLAIADIEAIFLAANDSSESPPMGAVGLIAAGVEDVPELLRDMTRHYAHYRATATAFARSFGEAHDPQRTIDELTASARLRLGAPVASSAPTGGGHR